MTTSHAPNVIRVTHLAFGIRLLVSRRKSFGREPSDQAASAVIHTWHHPPWEGPMEPRKVWVGRHCLRPGGNISTSSALTMCRSLPPFLPQLSERS